MTLLFDPEPDLETDRYGHCPACQQEVRVVRVDFGIGRYEAWGCKGVHHDWQSICATCEEIIP